MDNRSIKLKSRDIADYERSAKPIKLRRKYYKSEISERRRTLEKRSYDGDYEEEDSYEWEMCDEISLANGVMIDYYEYWNHPSFVEEKNNQNKQKV